MMKITLASVAAAAAMLMLTTAPLATPAKAQGVKMAQVDVQIGRDRGDRYDRDRRGATTPTPQLASARAASPSAHDSAAAW